LPYRRNQKLQNAATTALSVKTVASILRTRIDRRVEDVLGEKQFGFRRGKGTRNATGKLRIISK
jgi:hypothetical protein